MQFFTKIIYGLTQLLYYYPYTKKKEYPINLTQNILAWLFLLSFFGILKKMIRREKGFINQEIGNIITMEIKKIGYSGILNCYRKRLKNYVSGITFKDL